MLKGHIIAGREITSQATAASLSPRPVRWVERAWQRRHHLCHLSRVPAAPAQPSGPAHTMGRRYDPPKPAIEDLPLSYLGNEFRPEGPAFTLPKGQRGASGAGEDVPGPGQYSSKARETGPSYTMGVRHRERGGGEEGPAPGGYEVGEVRREEGGRRLGPHFRTTEQGR